MTISQATSLVLGVSMHTYAEDRGGSSGSEGHVARRRRQASRPVLGVADLDLSFTLPKCLLSIVAHAQVTV